MAIILECSTPDARAYKSYLCTPRVSGTILSLCLCLDSGSVGPRVIVLQSTIHILVQQSQLNKRLRPRGMEITAQRQKRWNPKDFSSAGNITQMSALLRLRLGKLCIQGHEEALGPDE